MVCATPCSLLLFIIVRDWLIDSKSELTRSVAKWFILPLGVSVVRDCMPCVVIEPRPTGRGGGTLGYWHHDRRREAAAGAALT